MHLILDCSNNWIPPLPHREKHVISETAALSLAYVGVGKKYQDFAIARELLFPDNVEDSQLVYSGNRP